MCTRGEGKPVDARQLRQDLGKDIRKDIFVYGLVITVSAGRLFPGFFHVCLHFDVHDSPNLFVVMPLEALPH